MNKLILVILYIGLSQIGLSQDDNILDLIQEAKVVESSNNPTGQILAKWLQVYNAIDKDNKNPQYRETCMAIADIYYREQLYEQALPYYLQSRNALIDNQSIDSSTVYSFDKIAQTYAHLSHVDSAEFYFDKILNYKIYSNNINGQINTLKDIADAFTQNRKYQRALQYNLRIKDIYEAHKSTPEELYLAYNNLGYNYTQLKKYEDAIINFEQALGLISKDDFSSSTVIKTNIGIAFYNLGEFENSIDYLNQARKIVSKNTPNKLDEIDQLLAAVYLKKNDLYNALNYVEQSEKLARANRNDSLLVDVFFTAAQIHSELYEYDLAIDYFQEHLELRDSFALVEKLRQQQLLQQQIDLERLEKQIELFAVNEDVRKLEIKRLKAEADNQQLAFRNKEVQLLAEQKEKEVLVKENELKASKIQVQESEAIRTRQELELIKQNLKVSQQEKENFVLQETKSRQLLEIKEKETQLLQEQSEKNVLLHDKEINDIEIQKQKERERFFYGLSGLMSLILLLIAGGLFYYRKLNKQLFQKNVAINEQKEEISQERTKSDNLLLNILPEQIATELKEKGTASTKKYENVSILFTDFKGFTSLVATIPASTLVSELNDIFSYFDDVMDEFEIEKIETIGDAYMAACGLPIENSDHAIKCVYAADKMLSFLKERNKKSEIQWNMRVGIHSGPVVAGVVGKKKFAYDLFGDTVNTASRIESNGEAGKINISHATYDLIKENQELKFENRGHIAAKGKGEIEMWFVNRT